MTTDDSSEAQEARDGEELLYSTLELTTCRTKEFILPSRPHRTKLGVARKRIDHKVPDTLKLSHGYRNLSNAGDPRA